MTPADASRMERLRALVLEAAECAGRLMALNVEAQHFKALEWFESDAPNPFRELSDAHIRLGSLQWRQADILDDLRADIRGKA